MQTVWQALRRVEKLDRMPFEDAERVLLMRLARQRKGLRDLLYQLVRLHMRAGDPEKAAEWTLQIWQTTGDLELTARCLAGIGCLLRKREDWHAAIGYFRQALGLEPMNTPLRYYIHANLGLCLGKIGEFGDAEKLCRLAISLLPDHPTAYDCLGLTLQAQGKAYEAAESFLKALETNQADLSVVRNLEDLIKDNPHLRMEYEQVVDDWRAAAGLADILSIEFEFKYAPGFRAKIRRAKRRFRGLMVRAR